MNKHSDAGEATKFELNMTSMIDVVFQLLIFFMVTLTILPDEQMSEIDVVKSAPNPAVEKGPTTPGGIDFDDIQLSLSVEAGKVVRRLDSVLMPSDDCMRDRLKLLKTYNNRARMCIRCGEDVPYVYLVRAINVAADTQVTVAFADLK